ncbi:SRSO17 transposase [Lentzea nigeriaca]|nr:SRSO17 transposase [Lentzea nigeriaca]
MQRQYSGTAGRIENSQIGVFLTYASRRGHALIDRELYLPASWIADRDRCRAAGSPDEEEFRTKPQQAQAMLEPAFDTGVPAGWVLGDEVYGQTTDLRRGEDRDVGYVLATKVSDMVSTAGTEQRRVDELAAELHARAWRRLSAGTGAHGPRYYDWARAPCASPNSAPQAFSMCSNPLPLARFGVRAAFTDRLVAADRESCQPPCPSQ